ncbi:hypothetical protein [Streptomyces sp. H34-S4]|uniref:hypothetical protein n=1 Tax=Streptomyces sp. H34-S4 TaxID=2996463 RepID=UPI002271AAC5|nr:hypothetical protein [Streptomyces sp. H34-S4]MCY0937707.1 hypothetical protein [Streptomyces sp. H34-S4]
MKRSTTMTTAALLTGLTLFVTACTGGADGSDGSDGSDGKKDEKKDSSSSAGGSGAGTSGADLDAALKTRKCLRDNGVDAPDPKPGEDPRGMTLGAGDGDSEAMKKAFEKCGVKAPGSGGEVPQADKDRALKTAKCMRDKGFDMKDPEFNGGMMSANQIPEGVDQQAFMDQLNKCSSE